MTGRSQAGYQPKSETVKGPHSRPWLSFAETIIHHTNTRYCDKFRIFNYTTMSDGSEPILIDVLPVTNARYSEIVAERNPTIASYFAEGSPISA
ncbi:MAG: hypothetical protein GY761_02920 [Hyphomicrobiales bacterium]|nr:hypothetical protein [Hyphomicrobiales bacterium]